MRSSAIPRVLALGLAALAAQADQVQVDIRNARPGKQIDVSVRSAEANGATSGQVDAAGSLSALLEVANLGKAKPAQATVQVAECTDEPDRLTVVGEGTKEQGFDEGRYADAFVQHTRKNVEASGGKWKGETDKALRQVVPGRWRDIQRILAAASGGGRSR